MKRINTSQMEAVFLKYQTQIRGQRPPEELIVLDGKEPNAGGGYSILTAVCVPSQYYLGSAVASEKTNEIPVAQQQLLPAMDLEGRLVSLDALHTQDKRPGSLSWKEVKITC